MSMQKDGIDLRMTEISRKDYSSKPKELKDKN